MLKPICQGGATRKWRVFWVLVASPRVPMLAGWADVVEHEASTGIRSGDPILLAPDYRIGKLLSLYAQSGPHQQSALLDGLHARLPPSTDSAIPVT
ncbi:hypothetical protein ACH4TX_10005 [Streptomyces sp. NPDC021098]|uniref:hypothetical protein n=1 Tax=unclassified Streptomyces TaxID=2593676 RepID=UPI00378AE90C